MTREAVVFLLLLASISMAGFNSGNNLLYLMSGVMLGTLILSFVVGRINLSGIRAERRLPRHAFARRPFRAPVEVTNSKRFLRSFGICIEEGGADEAGGPGTEKEFLLSIESGGKTTAREKRIVIDRRGAHTFAPIVLRSSYPFGLFNMKRKASDAHEMIVYPHIWDMNRAPSGSSAIRDEFPSHLKGLGSELYGFREYRHGEEATNISWKLSAKIGNLIVRETEHEERRRVCIVFDSVIKDTEASTLEAFERAVSATASLVWYLCGNGYSVKLVTLDDVVGYGSGPDQMHKMLTALALIQPLTALDPPQIAGKAVLEGGVGVYVTAGGSTTVAGKSGGDFSAITAARRETR
jgi:uncharacterized protein (DUF58 family)